MHTWLYIIASCCCDKKTSLIGSMKYAMNAAKLTYLTSVLVQINKSCLLLFLLIPAAAV